MCLCNARGACAAITIVASLFCLPAAAQTGRSAGASRAGRPSDTVGRTGGVYTRESLESTQHQRAISDLSSRLSTSTSQFRRGGLSTLSDDARITGPITRDPFTLLGPNQSVGVRRYTPGLSYMQRMDPTANSAANISGLAWSMNLYTPEGGWGYNGPPNPEQFFGDAPQKSSDPFRAFFGLTDPPAEKEPQTESTREPVTDLALAIQDEMANRIQQHLQSGVVLFKAGTASRGDPIEKATKLARAMSIFDTVKIQDRASWVAPCLLFHTALDREQSFVAIRNLVELCKRYPRYFLDRPDITQFFGDAEAYRNQMRRYRQAGQYNPTSPEAFAIEAYCCWALNDTPRAKQALAKVAELSSGTDIEQDMRILRGTIEPALEQ